MTAPTAEDLTSIELFAELDPADRSLVAEWLEVEDVEAGRRLTHQGASGYAFFVLRSGGADVLVDGTVVSTLGPGDYFGEIALVEAGRQTATVRTTSPAQVWVMFGTRFRELETQHPAIARHIHDTASRRLQNAPE